MRLWMCALVLALLGWAPDCAAQAQVSAAPTVWLVNSEGTGAYAEAAKAFGLALSKSDGAALEVVQLNPAEALERLGMTSNMPPRVVVTLGTQAANAMAQAASLHATPLLCALLPRSSFAEVLRSSGRRASPLLTAVYLDQPLGRQLALIRLALPDAKRVGVLLGPGSATSLPALKAGALALGLTLVDAQVDPEEGVYAALRRVLERSDVLLAMPDPAVFGSASIQNILLASFRARIALLGFSPAYTRAGAALSLFTTPTQVGQQAAGLVTKFLGGQKFSANPLEPVDFEVEVNTPVAHALGLRLVAPDLRQALKRGESAP